MTLPLRTLTNAGDPLCTPDGQVLSGVHVSFQLVDRYGVETDVWDALTHERVGGEPIVATTNEDGEFSIDLWPNSRGNRPTRYRCTVDHPAFKAFSGTVDHLSLDPLQWVEFMAASATIAPQDLGEMSLYRQELAAGLQTLGTAVGAAGASATASQGSATAAGASASQAASQAAAASASATAAAGSATTASTQAGEASASAGSAAGSASAAAAAQSAAAASAATASTQAGAAADSAGQSASSASTASTQAGVASTQAGQAATSATLAQQWATRTDAEVVAGQGYGAMKYALDAAGSASAASSAASAAAATAAGLQTALDGKVDASDPRLSDAREWTAATVTQPEAEAGTDTTRRAWTAQRVFQAVAAWWAGSAAKTKLDGIATGATANATDAQLRDRATHTGTQAIGTVSGLQAALDGKAAAAAGIPDGGATAQVLEKSSAANQDVRWATLHSVARSGDYNALSNRPGAIPAMSITDTRYDFPLPNGSSAYMRTLVAEFKAQAVGTRKIFSNANGRPGGVVFPDVSYGTLITLSPWGDTTGGMPIQIGHPNDATSRLFIRAGFHGMYQKWSSSGAVPVAWAAGLFAEAGRSVVKSGPSTGFNNLQFRCTVAGTTGATEPVWPTVVGEIVVDGTATWTAEPVWDNWRKLLDSDDTAGAVAKLVTVTAGAAGTTSGSVAHGLTRSKIVGFSATVNGAGASSGPGSSDATLAFQARLTDTHCTINYDAAAATAVYGRPVSFLLWYTP